MNSMMVKAKLKNICRARNVDFNSVLRFYMYDRFIERLAVSRYRDNFILKGGFYLSTFFGVENRTTLDIDTLIKNTIFNELNIKKMILEIIALDIGDNSVLEFLKIEEIREDHIYGGYRVSISVTFENMKDRFHIDVATGDPITPEAINYDYLPIINDQPIKIMAYNMETILAEKTETILNRAEACTRMKDYYDVYLIYKMYWKNIVKNNLINAFKNTFLNRNFKGNIKNLMHIIENSTILKEKWNNYSKKNNYSKNIQYEEITNIIKQIINYSNLPTYL
ncbi:MAG: Uncharacterized protein FD141_547 [Fusobacteria bacterium]|nr:MAG: Uncharacterized protein FD141_547 [Fusobacteriota bacterium]KAF0228788.1 MAG: hypothetical protein FD182_1044 [Fusobacteriota bacterium]